MYCYYSCLKTLRRWKNVIFFVPLLCIFFILIIFHDFIIFCYPSCSIIIFFVPCFCISFLSLETFKSPSMKKKKKSYK